MSRLLRRLLTTLATVTALYFVGATLGATLLLNHLTVPGTVDWSGANNPNPPSEPTELGYRGDPAAALGLAFETVHYPPTSVPPRPGWSPAPAPLRPGPSMSTASAASARTATSS